MTTGTQFTYTLTNSSLADNAQLITRSDGATIPPDPGNADFQAYLVFLAAGNTPNPAPVPPPPTAAQAAQTQYNNMIAAGLTITWTTSTALNATYGCDPTTTFNITAESISILMNSTFTNGQGTRMWPATVNGAATFINFTVAQFKTLATTIGQYVDALAAASVSAAAGQPTTWPSATVTLNM
jgi:hypothetical protein